MRLSMEELARRRAELIIVTLEEEEVKAKTDGIARRKRIRGRMLAEAEGDWAGLLGAAARTADFTRSAWKKKASAAETQMTKCCGVL